ncbi:hypothetical protein RIF29_15999 [Crotalaria pallida]|uniref:Uncharacterized protein n=1 Tax=Crotalaria pallida TaxID=3830 RepID=A0AAN9IBM8_CROPI
MISSNYLFIELLRYIYQSPFILVLSLSGIFNTDFLVILGTNAAWLHVLVLHLVGFHWHMIYIEAAQFLSLPVTPQLSCSFAEGDGGDWAMTIMMKEAVTNELPVLKSKDASVLDLELFYDHHS